MNKGNEGAKGNYMDEALHNGQQTVTAEEYDRNRQDWPGALTCVGRCGARAGLTHWTPSGGGDVPGIPKFRLLAKENHAPGCPYGTVLSRDVSRRGSHRASPPPAISPAVIRVRIQVAAQADAPSGDAGDRREGDEKRPAQRLRVRRWGQMQPHEDMVCPLAARDRAIRVSGEPGPRLSFRRSGYRQLIIAPWRSFFYVSPVDDGRCYDYLSNWQATQEAARQAARLERPIHPLCIEGYVRDRKDLGDGRFRVRLHAPLVEPHDRPRAGVAIRPRIAAWGVSCGCISIDAPRRACATSRASSLWRTIARSSTHCRRVPTSLCAPCTGLWRSRPKPPFGASGRPPIAPGRCGVRCSIGRRYVNFDGEADDGR
jgi:hypothetical protein